MLRPINHAHFLLLAYDHLRPRPILLSDLGILGPFVRVDEVGPTGAVKVALEPGDYGW
jgi:hypothetical protein